jgi:hypothetical protein
LSYEFFEKRFLSLKRLFETAEATKPYALRLAASSFREGSAIVQGSELDTKALRKDKTAFRKDIKTSFETKGK